MSTAELIRSKKLAQSPPPRSEFKWWAIAISIALLIIALAGAALAFVPQLIVDNTFRDYKANNIPIEQTALVSASTSARQTVTLAVGGIIAIFTFLLSLAKHRVTTQELALEKLRHERDGDSLWANRYSEAIAQFTNKESDSIRLGGIYNLERIAQESENDRQPILEVLCSYLRENYRTNQASDNGAPRRFNGIRESEILTVRDVVVRLVRDFHPRRLDLTGVNLAKTDLSYAHLMNAQLSNADLSEVNLYGANLAQANLKNSLLHRANLSSATLIQACLNGADFDHAKLNSANLYGSSAEKTIFDNADLTRTDLGKSTCIAANFNSTILDATDFTSANLDNAFIDNANLAETLFYKAQLNDTSITNCHTRMMITQGPELPISLDYFKKQNVIYEDKTPPHIVP